MLKIIEKIDLPVNVYPKQIRCQTCNSLIEYSLLDQKIVKAKNLTGPVDYDAIGFVCPVCGNIIIVG